MGLAVLYMLLLFLSEFLFEGEEFTGHFEPASGLALAALLIGGMRYARGILLGGIMAHLGLGEHWREVIPELLADTLQAVIGAWLLSRSGFNWRSQTLRDYFTLIQLGGVAGVSAGGLIVIGGFWITGSLYPGNYLEYLQHWWMGDILGVVLVTPLILSWWQREGGWQDTRKIIDAVLLLGVTALIGQIVFFDWLHDELGGIAQSYWMFMFIAWVAMVLGVRGTMLALLLVAVQALAGAMQGTGSFAHDVTESHLTNFWFYMLVLSMVGMSLATYFTEIKEANSAVAHRDVLIREIHHRIKNNLQGVTGLLCLLADSHPEIAEPVNQTIGQLQNIAAIHGMQERASGDKVHLRDLVGNVVATVNALWQRSIELHVPDEWKPYIVSPAEVVPLSLVINELLSNANKHSEPSAEITCKLEQNVETGFMRLTICNTEHKRKEPAPNGGSGLQLVKSLMPKTGAKLTWQHQDEMVVAVLEIGPPVISPEALT